MTDQLIKDALRAVDPARDIEGPVDARAHEDLNRILRTTRAARRRTQYGRLVVAGAAAVLAVAVLVVQPWAGSGEGGAGTAYAGTPPMLKFQVVDKRPADEQLLDLAARVRKLPAEQPTGPVLRITAKGWYLVSGDVTEDYVEPHANSRYVTGGRVRTQESGRLTEGVAAFWPSGLSSDPKVLKEQLKVAHPGDTADSFLNAVTDLQGEANPGPGVRAAILTLLAEQEEVRAEGSVVDRGGRAGVAFSITTSGGGLPIKRTLIFDGRTGVLLSAEDMLTETAGKMNVPIPSVISYTSYLSRGYVDSLPK